MLSLCFINNDLVLLFLSLLHVCAMCPLPLPAVIHVSAVERARLLPQSKCAPQRPEATEPPHQQGEWNVALCLLMLG